MLHGVDGESARIVENEGVGIRFEPDNAEALREGLLTLWRDPELRKSLGESGIRAAKKYDRAGLAVAMLDILERVASPSRRQER